MENVGDYIGDEERLTSGSNQQSSRRHQNVEDEHHNDDDFPPREQSVPMHLIACPMSKLNIFKSLQFKTTTLHAKNQVERQGQSRWGFITGEETQYAQQKQNLIQELNDIHDPTTNGSLPPQTAEMWLQREAAASLIPENKPNNIKDTYIGAFDAGSTGSKTKTRFEELYKTWEAEALKPKTYEVFPHGTRFDQYAMAVELEFNETIEPLINTILLKKTFSTDLEEKQLSSACLERVQQLSPKGSSSSANGGIFNSYNKPNAAKLASINLLNKLVEVTTENIVFVSANDWLALEYEIRNIKESAYYGAFKDSATLEIFEAAKASWRVGIIKDIQNRMKTQYDIFEPRERSHSQLSSGGSSLLS